MTGWPTFVDENPKLVERALQTIQVMHVNLDREQTQIIREILEGTLIQLRIESARADMHDFRELLHRRERLVERTLAQLSDTPVSRMS